MTFLYSHMAVSIRDAKVKALEAQLTAQAEERDRLKVEVDWQARCVDIIAHGEGIEASLLPGLRAQLTAQAEELDRLKVRVEALERFVQGCECDEWSGVQRRLQAKQLLEDTQ